MNPIRSTKAVGVRVGLIGAVAIAAAPSAWAHVTVNPNSAVQGSYSLVSFEVPDEDDSAATTKVEVQFPTDHPIASVSTENVPGWTTAATTRKLAQPLTTDDGQVTSAVSTITWSGGAIAAGQFQSFPVSIGPLPNVKQLVFKVLQTYSNGKTIRWIDEPVAGGAEPEHPAPVLTLTAPGAAANSADPSGVARTSPSPQVTVVQKKSPSSASAAAISLGSAGLALGLIGAALGSIAWTRLRRRPADDPASS